jgi:hypothetical protein
MRLTLYDELEWLKNHPDFEERPATFEEFLGAEYLDIEGMLRPRILQEMKQMFGSEVDGFRIAQFSEGLVTGGIGIGKTTIASVVLPYMAHWVLCLKDPQRFFNLLPGSRIAFMMMSTSESQALEVVFGDVKARINHSPWFKTRYEHDQKFKNQIRFPKDIWIIPGDSKETTFEGYNILGGILDEGDSHQVTKNKDYAEVGYTTISSRITSRFQDRGFLLVIGQMKRANGFMARKYNEFSRRDDCYAVRLSIWESMGKDFYKDKDGGQVFTYDTLRRLIIPGSIASIMGSPSHLIEVPELYRKQFEQNPEKALRDLAGIPPLTGNPYISLVDRITECRDRWVAMFGSESPVGADGRIGQWFRATDKLQRVGHLDIAYSGDGDALGFAMGHIREMIEVDGELKPLIVIDMAIRIKAMPGSEIFLSDVRQLIYSLRDERGFNLTTITCDGFQSTDSMQQFQRKRFAVEYLSVDRQLLPYSDLRDAIYDRRINFPPYYIRSEQDGVHGNVEIIVKELSELVDLGTKVDHPDQGSKDVTDAIAGVVHTLMGDRRYGRRTLSLSQPMNLSSPSGRLAIRHHPAVLGDQGKPLLPHHHRR